MKALIIFLITSLFSGCMYTDGRSRDHVILVSVAELGKTISSIGIIEGEAELLGDNIYRLRIKGVRGGSTFFLGQEVKRVDGDEHPRIKIVDEDGEEYPFSVNEILGFGHVEKDGHKIYLISSD